MIAIAVLAAMSGWRADATTPAPAGTPAAAAASPAPPDPCGGPARLLATADRPTIGFSTCAVVRGTAVFELGYQNQIDGTPGAGAIESQAPQSFLRLGVAPRFELDVIGPNYVRTRAYAPGTPGSITSGVTDSGIGFKAELPPAGRWGVAFDGLYAPPNGSPFLTTGNATFTANLDAAYALGPSTGVGTTIAVSSTGGYGAGGSHARYGVTTPSLVVTEQIPNFYQFYAEYAFVSKLAPGEGGRAFTDFGVQKLLGSHLEIDLEYGHAFTAAPTLKFDYVGAGAVVEVP